MVVTSWLFALPHLEAWSMLGALLVGLSLGWVRLAFGCVAPCIGLHAGLNLASLLCGTPPMRFALPKSAALLLLALSALAILWQRRRVVGLHSSRAT